MIKGGDTVSASKLPFAVLMPLWLAACAVGPDFKQPPAPPSAAGYSRTPIAPQTAGALGDVGSAQRFAVGSDIPGQWWTLFQSSELNDLIDRAFRASPTIAAAQAALATARENMLAQQGTLFPSVGVDMSGS